MFYINSIALLSKSVSRYIHNLISEGEHLKLDFKFEISDAKKMARTFAAFANTVGGRLLIGVKDNGNISGVRSEEEEYMAESSDHLYCKPKVNYEIAFHKINDKTILEIIIPESTNKPHKAPWKDNTWKAFVRVEDQNFIANKVIQEVWKIKHQNKKLIVRYDNYEESLFNLIREEGRISLSEFVRKCKIRKYLAIKIISQLVAIKTIDMVITEKETYYTILEE